MKKLFGKLISRKVLFYILATVFFAIGKMNANEWIICSSIFIGLNAVEKIAHLIKGGSGE